MKRIIKGLGIAVVAVGIVSCSATKQVTQKQETPATDKQAELVLSEKSQKEFEYLFVEALKQKVFGNTQKAIQLFSSCLSINPNSSAAMYELSKIHAANNDYTSASLLLEKAISHNPDNKWYKLLLAQVYQQSNKSSEAADIYADLLEKDPENIEYTYTHAALLSDAKRYDEALEAFNKMEKKTGINEQVSVAKQQIYVAEGKTEKAFAEIHKLIDHSPREPRYYGLLADLYKSRGDKEHALENYRKVLEIEPDNGFVHFSLAGFYLEEGDTSKWFDETRKAFASPSLDVKTKLQYYMMITANPEQQDMSREQQKELIQILFNNYPEEALVHTIYAEYLIQEKDYNGARTQLLEATQKGKNDYVIWERIMYIDNDLQDWKSLYAHTRKIIELFPNQPQGYFFSAMACLQLEKLEETIEITQEGLEYVVQNPTLKSSFLALKAEALYKQDKKAETFKVFDKVLELDPDNYMTLNNYAYYLSVEGKDLDKAERMSGKVVEKFPDNATYLDTYAWVLFKKGNYKLAKYYMQSAIENNKENSPTLYEHYGDILFMLQKTDEALSYWEKAKENGGDSEILQQKIRKKKYIEE